MKEKNKNLLKTEEELKKMVEKIVERAREDARLWWEIMRKHVKELQEKEK